MYTKPWKSNIYWEITLSLVGFYLKTSLGCDVGQLEKCNFKLLKGNFLTHACKYLGKRGTKD